MYQIIIISLCLTVLQRLNADGTKMLTFFLCCLSHINTMVEQVKDIQRSFQTVIPLTSALLCFIKPKGTN